MIKGAYISFIQAPFSFGDNKIANLSITIDFMMKISYNRL